MQEKENEYEHLIRKYITERGMRGYQTSLTVIKGVPDELDSVHTEEVILIPYDWLSASLHHAICNIQQVKYNIIGRPLLHKRNNKLMTAESSFIRDKVQFMGNEYLIAGTFVVSTSESMEQSNHV